MEDALACGMNSAKKPNENQTIEGTSLVIQWLILCFNAGAWVGSILFGNKNPHGVWCMKRKKVKHTYTHYWAGIGSPPPSDQVGFISVFVWKPPLSHGLAICQ